MHMSARAFGVANEKDVDERNAPGSPALQEAKPAEFIQFSAQRRRAAGSTRRLDRHFHSQPASAWNSADFMNALAKSPNDKPLRKAAIQAAISPALGSRITEPWLSSVS